MKRLKLMIDSSQRFLYPKVRNRQEYSCGGADDEKM